ncbi:MAG: N-acetyl-gamma-glutamyl-phosphate reductase [Candidatus Omnitrophica bacterium]|nr:N-acetyl-gamma-glutamyl-phosphate reductase [Candidatus Omnitrophota bacterium]
MIKVGIVGATGYAGAEAIRILLGHKDVKITELARFSDTDEPISTVFPEFKGRIDMICKKIDATEISRNVDFVFLGLPHKAAMDLVPIFIKAGKSVVDLSADYRLSPEAYKKWYGLEHKDKANLPKAVYGLPELYRDAIKKSKLIANPGCYPTSVILGTAPALKTKAIDPRYIIADSKSGTSGAGRKADLSLSFCEVNENLKAYKVNEHQHMPEMNKILFEVSGEAIDMVFTPHLIPMNRGILSTIYLRLNKKFDTKAVIDMYKDFYKGKPFVRVLDEGIFPQIKSVVMTNYCDIGIKVSGENLIVVSCIDNLTKGAAGQAVQNMNIMCGFPETEGLI